MRIISWCFSFILVLMVSISLKGQEQLVLEPATYFQLGINNFQRLEVEIFNLENTNPFYPILKRVKKTMKSQDRIRVYKSSQVSTIVSAIGSPDLPGLPTQLIIINTNFLEKINDSLDLLIHYYAITHVMVHFRFGHFFGLNRNHVVEQHMKILEADFQSGLILSMIIARDKNLLDFIIPNIKSFLQKIISLHKSGMNYLPSLDERMNHLVAGFLASNHSDWEFNQPKSINGSPFIKLSVTEGGSPCFTTGCQAIGESTCTKTGQCFLKEGAFVATSIDPRWQKLQYVGFTGKFGHLNKSGTFYQRKFYLLNGRLESVQRYFGSFNDSELEDGYGELCFQDGRLYKGDFRDGQISGKGSLYDAFGKVINTGTWSMGSFIK